MWNIWLKISSEDKGFLHTEIERVLMPHMYSTRKYRENEIKVLNIDKEQVDNPQPLV